ncbi:MAG: cytidylate kinase-like family protein [Synergistaceae bacterium]|jgi:cytidylate kinase|nr:cytidylate kinase-like family protein [Synergistaceae bacterium]
MGNNVRIITISREFGSGGRSVAKMVAEKLEIGYYDKELVKQVASETGFDQAYVEQAGEYAPEKSSFTCAFSSNATLGALNGMSVDDFLWVIQRKIILQLAEKGPAVIVGRCADYILKERGDCFNVFIHASMAARADRIVHLYGETDKRPEKRLEEKDKKRKLYYRHYTNQEWGMSQNYNLSLDSSFIGVEKCAEIITVLAK